MQLYGSIAVAIAIIAVTIALVTAKLGPNAEDDHGGDNSGKGKQEQPLDEND